MDPSLGLMSSMANSSFPMVKMEASMASSFGWPNSYWQQFQQSQALQYPSAAYSAAYSQYYGGQPGTAGPAPPAATAYGTY